jgi:hypothetical protein
VPVPLWLFYTVVLLFFAFLNNAIFWLDGSLAAGSFDRVRLLDSIFMVFFVALYHHLNRVAGQSFRAFQPALTVPQANLEILEFRLTTLPWGFGWLALCIGIGLGLISVQSDPVSYGLDVAKTLLPVPYQYAAQIFVIAAMVAVVIQTIRQLRIVDDLHRRADEIDLFHLTPTHAFADLTAQAAIGLLLFILYNQLLEAVGIPAAPLYIVAILATLALCTFVLPLLGMRKRLKDEKTRLLDETNEAIKMTIGRIHGEVNENQYEKISALSTAMSALVAERDLISGISIWPWEASTLRGFASAFLLPIFLYVVTRFLETLF